jgi:CheY-like chemotaxis protein
MIDGNMCADIRFLVADDNASMNELVEMVVASLGAKSVVRVDGGLKALAAIEREVPDVLITDLDMRDLDGISLTRRIRSMPEPARSLHIIMVTGKNEASAEAAAKDAGVDVFITKPIWTRRLFAALQDYAAKR